jgi:hypothetical protein
VQKSGFARARLARQEHVPVGIVDEPGGEGGNIFFGWTQLRNA